MEPPGDGGTGDPGPRDGGLGEGGLREHYHGIISYFCRYSFGVGSRFSKGGS